MDYRKVKEMIKGNEGLRLKPYKCPAGKITIGYGRNLEDKGITVDEADNMLFHDVCEVLADLRCIFQEKVFSDFSEPRQHALIDMRYQLGFGGFRSFKKMIQAIQDDNWPEAIKQVKNSRYYTQVTNRANRVCDMMEVEI